MTPDSSSEFYSSVKSPIDARQRAWQLRSAFDNPFWILHFVDLRVVSARLGIIARPSPVAAVKHDLRFAVAGR